MILAHNHIKAALNTGAWTCHRDGEQVSSEELTINPNSVNVGLGNKFLVPKIVSSDRYINLHKPESVEWTEYTLPYIGYPLDVGAFILGHTRERFDCSAPLLIDGKERCFAPMIEGRSTVARCGLSIHECAGYGDVNFKSSFTLEITTCLPIKLYYCDEIAQVYFAEVSDGSVKYDSVYSEQHDAPKAPVLGKDRFQRHA